MSTFDTPPQTDGERTVWATAYAAAWVALRGAARTLGTERADGAIASDAADEAWGALYELRALAQGGGDFATDARSVVTGKVT